MSKDRRLFIRLDLDYADHPKIMMLSDEAFRAHITFLLYSRKYMTDGVINNRVANRFASQWDTDVLTELTTNDEATPSLVKLENGDYYLHGYEDMQETRAEIELRTARNQANGRKGGRPPKTQSVTESLTESGTQNLTESKAETETEIETEIEVPKGTSSSEVETSRPEYEKLLDLLDSLIVANGSKKPSRSKKNVDAVRLMVERDNRSLSDIEGAIRWSQANDFWRGNILSMSKLREKFDQLRLAAQRDREKREGSQLTENQTRAVSLHQQYLQEEGEGFAEITVG